jgi:hypothetical protein
MAENLHHQIARNTYLVGESRESLPDETGTVE